MGEMKVFEITANPMYVEPLGILDGKAKRREKRKIKRLGYVKALKHIYGITQQIKK